MDENWVLLFGGVVLVCFGFTAADVRGPMPGAKPLYAIPFRMRVILISFGVLFLVLGGVGLIRR